MPACPKCGKEVGVDYTYCPYCETQLRPFCPSCKRSIQPDFVRCPYCGFDLSPLSTAEQLYRKRERPLRVVVLSVIWVVAGIINLYQGYGILTSNYDIYQSAGSLPPYIPQVATLLIGLGALLAALGIALFVFAYGFFSLRFWAQNSVVSLAGFIFLLYLMTVLLGEWAQNTLYRTPFFSLWDEFLMGWSIVFVYATWRYARNQEIWNFLYSEPVKGQ